MAVNNYLDNSEIAERIFIANGQVVNTSFIHKFGAAPAISINTTGTIWDINDTLYPWSAFNTAGVLTIPAVNASDNGNVIEIQGLDENWMLQTETITVSSSVTVTTTKSYKRVFRAFDKTGTNVGNINIQRGGTTVARITAGRGQTLMAVYTIPKNYTGFLCQGVASIKYGGDATIDMFVRYAGETSFRIGHTGEVAGTGMPYSYQFTIPVAIPAMSDIDVRASVRSNNSRVTAAFDIILVKNR